MQLPSVHHARFRKRFCAGEGVIGTFIKTPSVHSIEIVGSIGFDFVVIDREHGPFDRGTLDLALLATRAAGTAGLVRVAEAAPPEILSVLDCGAAGVLVPHVSSAEKARAVVDASRYRGGRRGFSAAGRAGLYGGTPMQEHLRSQDEQITVIAMIEDPEALACIDEIAAVDGIDGLFVGRSDLTVSMGLESPDAPQIKEAVRRIASAARTAGKTVCVMAAGLEEAQAFLAMGVSAFIVDSDQAFLRKAAAAALRSLEPLKGRS